MANLSRPSDDADGDTGRAAEGDRGQLILVTALAIAVAMVALVLLVNTAIFTENLASRDVASGDREVFEYRQSLTRGVGAVIDAENRAEYGGYPSVRANVSDSINRTDALIRRTKVERGAVAAIDRPAVAFDQGALVRQPNGSRNFSNESGAKNWTVATDVSGTRRYAATVDNSTLLDLSLGSAADGFHVVLNNSSAEWHVYVYEDTLSGNVTVAVKNASQSSPNEVCTTSQSPATVDFTAGTLAGTECSGLQWARGLVGSYDVEFRNGDEAVGTYNATLNVTGGSVNGGSLNSGPAADSPYSVPAVYAARIPFTYESPAVRYVETIRVAPGEPDA